MDQARYAELFRTEAREHLAELDTTLLAYEQHADVAHVATLFRSTHTIKGMAAAMGYHIVEQLSHALESLLDRVRSGHAIAHAELIAMLFDGTDALRIAVDDAVSGRGEVAPESMAPLLQRLTAHHDEGPRHEPLQHLDAVPSVAVPVANETARRSPANGAPETAADCTIEVRLTSDCPLKGVRAMIVMTRLEQLGAVRHVSPAQATWTSELFDGVFAVTLHTAAAHAALESAVRAAGDVARVTIAAAAARAARESTSDALRTVRVDRRRLDTLLDLVGELVITRDRLLQLAETYDHSSTRALTRAAHDAARLIGALQDEVLQARMVPVGQVFDRFPRLVRDIARDLGKDVELVTEGRDIELDRALLDALADPLVHMLRNALDHGIEDAETRTIVGKPPIGRLVLRAARDRASIIIQVEDDGAGIDRRAILARAQLQGLLPADATSISDDELLQVLAFAGFSTARAVTAISGRGVGVDVVNTRVRALGGTMELETIEGQGTVFTLRLPLTLSITRALLVQVAGETYALPAAQVVEALEYNAGTIVTPPEPRAVRDASTGTMTLRDEALPIVHLRERFGHPRQIVEAYVAVVEVGGRRSAIVVDTLVAQRDIVVKPLDAVRGSAPWFSGATVLGDGTPALIVDLGSLT